MASTETLTKYLNNEKLNSEDVWQLLQDELFELGEIQCRTDFSDEKNIKACHKEEAIRFAMDLVQRME
jgi:hypothetical protein